MGWASLTKCRWRWVLISVDVRSALALTLDFTLTRAVLVRQALYASVRTLRLADGPDHVHLLTIAKEELRRRSSKL